ncbi:hypothetical protein SAMN05216226_1411 [Halovenus aranensis]|uniref:Uncharacterized protein n=1 Tax=Halovenus aranensis TaxID=890420 RepID=A0A1G8ZYD8_9EURY|nr:hypothetical protein [Halovenus aranensis]SDK19967.1 hypothetical protein SAMN05216226_1411 [Halovenus aranensis]
MEHYAPPRMAKAEKNLMDTVAEFYRAFHTYRRLAEEHLYMTLDEFLGESQTQRLPFDDRTGPRRLTEEKCRDVLERMQQYIDRYEESQQKVGKVLAEGAPDAVDGLGDDEITATGELMQKYDLDDMVEADVAEGLEDSRFLTPPISGRGCIVFLPFPDYCPCMSLVQRAVQKLQRDGLKSTSSVALKFLTLMGRGLLVAS